jgi:hypothetical protein
MYYRAGHATGMNDKRISQRIPFIRARREKRDWKTKDEIAGWCRSTQRNNMGKDLEQTDWMDVGNF